MPTACEETLAGGLWREGRQHRRAVLRELDHETQRELLETAAAALPAERVTALLAQAVAAIDEIEPIGRDEIRELPIGDRDRLVLSLRRLLHGEQLQCMFACGCGEPLELELEVGALLGARPDAKPRELSAVSPGGVQVRVRAASGADHERAARLALTDPAAAARALVDACVVEPRGPETEASAEEIADAAEKLLAELDPGAELLLAGDCPACGQQAIAVFDPISHLWAELERRRARLEYEVHVLALHYHWSEREIVSLGASRRARYLDQLDRQLAVT